MSILEVDNLSMRFGGLVAVNEVDLQVKPGQILALIGPNGAGKTTVFNALTGVYEPSEGRILFEGSELGRGFSGKTFLNTAGAGLLTGFAFLAIFNVQSLWEAAIIANYVYLEPFPWRKALADAAGFFGGLPARDAFLPLLAGFLAGSLGVFSIWRRSRRSPEVVSRSGIARTFQNIRLFQEMTVLENLLVAMDARERSSLLESALRLPRFFRLKSEHRERAMELLRFVGLEGEADSEAGSLPYGHQRRLEIARALACRPRLLLLDEPAAGMNPSESMELVELVRRIRERGISVLLIEHHMKVVMSISDNIVVLDYGNKIAEGAPAEIKSNPRVIEAYLGKGD